ncbi:MAG: SulP family inorganic anion transporter [Planctomycetota bacterium]
MHPLLKEWKYDLPAGLVVFLVAIPLCLGIALASGAPLFSGIIAGIVGGIIVSALSNSALGVSGPAAGLVAIVVVAIESLGFDSFLMAVVVAGGIQVVLGLLRCGIVGYYFPSSVIKGMLAAIGLIIILKQIPHALGRDADYEGDLAFQQADGHNTFSEIPLSISNLSEGAVLICGLSLALLVLWERPWFRRHRIFRIVQGPLVAVLVGVGLGMLFRGSEIWGLEADQMVALPVPDDWDGFLAQFVSPNFSAITNPSVWLTGLTLAIVASLESLLSTEATDKLDPFKRRTNLNRELTAQGVGNLCSGMLGGLPVTQVIVRSSTNIQSGARTGLSAFFHGVLMLLCVAMIPEMLNLIPLASLAAVLIIVGFKLAHPSKFIEMYRMGWDQFAPFLATIAAVLLTDLLIGIGIGLAVSFFFILRQNYLHAYWLHEEHIEDQHHMSLVLAESVSYLSKGSIMKMLHEIPPNSKILIDGSHSLHIDPDVRDLLTEFKEGTAKHRQIDVELRLDVEKDKVLSLRQANYQRRRESEPTSIS